MAERNEKKKGKKNGAEIGNGLLPIEHEAGRWAQARVVGVQTGAQGVGTGAGARRRAARHGRAESWRARGRASWSGRQRRAGARGRAAGARGAVAGAGRTAWAWLGARAGCGLCTRCTWPIFDPF